MHLARSVAGVAVILAAAVGWGQSCPELGGWWEAEREATALAISGHHAYLATADEVRCQSPLQVSSRTYTNGQSGTFGQSFVGRLGSTGLRRESGWLIGLRQEEGVFRTNLSVTNAGTEPARAVVTLFGADGVQLAGRYLLEVEAGMTVQDLEPFARRAARPDLGWGFARVEATQGSGLLISASVIDSRSNDPTTVTMRR